MKALTEILAENGTFDGLDRRNEVINENRQKYEVIDVNTGRGFCVNTYDHMQKLIKEDRIKPNQVVQIAVVNYHGG